MLATLEPKVLHTPKSWETTERWLHKHQPWENEPDRPLETKSESDLFKAGVWLPNSKNALWLPTGHILRGFGPGARTSGNGNIPYSSAPVTAAPLTMSVWAKSTNTTAAQIAVNIYSDISNYYGIYFRGDGAELIQFAAASGGASSAAQSSAAYSNGVLCNVIGVEISTTSRVVYKDGANKGTNSVSRSPVTPDALGISGFNQFSSPFIGTISEVAVWNASFSDDDAAVFGARPMSALLMRPDALVFYAKILGNGTTEQDTIGHRSGTVAGTFTKAEHPNVLNPRSRIIVPKGNPATPVVSTIGTATLTLTTFAPIVSTPRRATIGVASLILTSFAPVVSTPRRATIGLATLALTSFAPVVRIGFVRTIGKASLVLASFAPVVSTPRRATIGVVSLILTTFAPVVIKGIRATIGLATLIITRFAPIVSAPRNVIIGVASLIITRFAPVVSIPRLVTVGKASLILTTFAPVIIAAQRATIGLATLILTAFAPVIQLTSGLTAIVGKATLVLTTFAPVVSTPRLVTIGKASLILTAFAPVVFAPRLSTIGKASLILTAFTISVFTPRIVTIGKASLVLTSFAPVVGTPKLLTIGVAALVLMTFAPIVSYSSIFTIGTASLVLTTYAIIVSVAAVIVLLKTIIDLTGKHVITIDLTERQSSELISRNSAVLELI